MKERMGIRAIIFDLDGVLLSTDWYHYMAWKKLADELGIPFSEKDNEAFRGVSRMDCMEILAAKRKDLKLTDEEKVAYANQKNEEYRKLLSELTPDFVAPAVRDTLADLKRKGYRMAVGSSSKNSKYILEKTALTAYFDSIIDGNDIIRSKPDPEVFLKAAEALDVSPDCSAVIEDAEAGLMAAVRAGMLPIAIGAAEHSPLAKKSLENFEALKNIF